MSMTLPLGSCFHQSSHVLPHTSFCVFDFVAEPHKAAERLQNHFENSGGQPALTSLLRVWKLPGRHRAGGEPGDNQTNGG